MTNKATDILMESELRGLLDKRKRLGVIGAIAVLMPLFLAVGVRAEYAGGNGKPVVEAAVAAYVPVDALSGAVTIAGSDTMQPLLARLASEFRRVYPDTKIAVQGGGTNEPLEAFIQGQGNIRRGDGYYKGHLASGNVSLLASSRPLTGEEIGQFRSRHGYEPTEIPIALDAVAIYVNRDNPLPGLTLEQVDAIFGKSRKRGLQQGITTWGEAGLQGGWEQKPIHLYGRDKRSGTRTFFQQVALLDGELKGEVKEEPGAASVILGVANDPFGIGYVGIGFQASMVRAVPLAEAAGKPFVPPSAKTTSDSSYPLRRHLYLYVNKAPKADLEPIILEFLKFANSREGQQTVIKAGVYPLPATEIANNLQILTGAAVARTRIAATSN